MRIETIGDVVHWARGHHQELSARLASSSATPPNDERARLLLSYLATHERKLSELLEHVEAAGDLGALNTFCYDYLDASPLEAHSVTETSWAGLDPAEILLRIEREHEQLIALYRHLRGQVDGVAAQELLDELISLERHEAMQVAQGANRLQDY